jgi:MFS family permease
MKRAVSALVPAPFIYYGWVIVAVAFVTLGMAFGIWYSFSVFFLAIINEFGWSRAAASSIYSVFIISQALIGPLAGHLQDRLGPRKTIPFGTVLLSLALLLTSQVQALWHYRIAYGLLAGAGVGILGFSSHSAFIPKWFERKRGFAMGLAMSGIGFGMLILVPAVENIITHYGWRTTYGLLAALIFFLVGPLNLIFSRKDPSELQLRPDGDQLEGQQLRVKPKRVMNIIDQEWAGVEWTLKRALKTKQFWFLVSGFFFGSYVYQGTLLHGISAMVDSGLSRPTAAYYFGILGLTGAAGKILFGFLSDRFEREKVNYLAGAITILGLFSLILVGNLGGPTPLLFALLFGLGYGAAAPLFPSVSADIFLGKSFGLIFGVMSIGGGLGGAAGSFLLGWIHDLTGTYSTAIALSCISLFLSCLLIWQAAPRKIRKMVLYKAVD